MERRSLYYDEGTLSETFGRPPSDEAGVLRGMRLSLLVVLAEGPAPGAVEGLFEAMRRFGMSEESLRVLRDFNPEGARFTDHIPAEVAPGSAHARRLVYALVAGALGDGVLGGGERRAVEEIAAHLARDLVLYRGDGDERWAVERGASERILPVCAGDGVLFVWHHARGEAPSWSVPVRRDARWSPIVTGSTEARHHVQELAENTVDATHGVLIHGFLEPTRIRSGRADGPFWRIVWDLAIGRSYEPDVEDLQMPEIGGLVDLQRPAITREEAALMTVRRWARQFYSGVQE